MEQFIKEWGYSDPWSYRELLTYSEARKGTIAAAKRFLVDNYGMSNADAEQYGQQLVNELTAAYFLIPGSYEEYFRNPQLFQSLDNLLAGDDSVPVSEDVLAFAVDNPGFLQHMINAGVNIDTANSFGKTPLMYAAHLNRLDSVNVLLKAGADIHKTTIEEKGYSCIHMQRTGRSALTYAAENASPEVILMLVDAGADIVIKDSQGNDLRYYLAKNPFLTTEQKAMPVQMLIDHLANVGQAKGPSFNCAKAKTRIEKRTCANATVAMHDRILDSSYHKWRHLAPDKTHAISAQREWLIERNTKCSSFTGDNQVDACLIQANRARSRYLHKLYQALQ
jgi:uncharacterized protein YecT (DUF1311 family)